MSTYLCPNCARHFFDLTASEHAESGCFLGMLIDIVPDPGVQLDSTQLGAFEDVDGLWDRYGGPAADELEAALRRSPPSVVGDRVVGGGNDV